MMAMLIAVYCPNRLCPQMAKTGKPRLVGEIEAGATARLQCRSCREIHVLTAHDEGNRIPA